MSKICPCCKDNPIEISGYCHDCETQVYELDHAADLRAIADTVHRMSPAARNRFRAQLDELI